MKKTTLFIIFVALLLNVNKIQSQIINEPANWPNTNWKITGNYTITELTNSPLVNSNFSFDNQGAGAGSQFDILQIISPIYDLREAITVMPSENQLIVHFDYVNYEVNTTLKLKYTVGGNVWVDWQDISINTASNTDYKTCNGFTNFISNPQSLTTFTEVELQNFRYGVFYDDNAANFQFGGFCIGSPILESRVTPVSCIDAFNTPYSENFNNNGDTPICWSQGINNNEPWNFSDDITAPGHIGNAGNVNGTSTLSGGYFAWVDDDDPNNLNTELITPFIDLTGTTNPILSFYYISNHEFMFSSVNFSVDLYDGYTLHEEIFTHSGNTVYWEQAFVDLSAYAGQTIQLKFIVDEVGFSYLDDFAIDDVYVGEMINCSNISSTTINNIGSDNIFISWDDANIPTSTNWQIVYGNNGFDVNSATPINTNNNNNFEINGLTSFTDYEIYIRSNCGGGDYSLWKGPIQFKTIHPIQNAPYIENFEDGGLLDAYWIQSESDASWLFSNDITNTEHVGNAGDNNSTTTQSNGYFAYINNSNLQTNNSITTPYINVNTISSPSLYLYYISNNEGGSNVNFSIDVWDGANWNTDFFTSNSNTEGWQQEVITLITLNITGPIQLKFIINGGIGLDNFAIDDVEINEGLNCWPIYDPIVSNATTTTIDITWTDNNNNVPPTTYYIEYGNVGFTPGTGTTQNVDMSTSPYNPCTITGLPVDTDFDFYVYAVCTDGELYVGPAQGTTLATCFPVTDIEISTITENSAVLTWTDIINTPETYEIEVVDITDSATGTGNLTTNLSYNINNILPLHTYKVYIRSKCGVNDYGRWQTKEFITSEPSNILNTPYSVNEIPYKLYDSYLTPSGIDIDDSAQLINLGFNFNYFGYDYSQIVVGENSYVSFNPNYESGLFGGFWQIDEGVLLPNVNIIGNTILGPFQDYRVNSGGTISYSFTGTAPFRKFIVFYDEVSLFGPDCNINSSNQIILHESYNFIDVQVKDRNVCTTWNGGRAILGIQSVRGQYAYFPENRNTGTWEAHNEAYRFTPEYNLPDFQYVICDTGTETFNLNTIYNHFNQGGSNTYTAFETLDDAQNNTNFIASTNYTNTSNTQTIFVRELDNGTVSIKRILLAVINCNEDYDLDTIPTITEDLNGNGNYGDDDTDGDALPNFMDEDDDGDFVLTTIEAVITINRNSSGINSYLDTDGDLIPNYLDNDDDDDGVSTLNEDYNGDFNPTNDDTNDDGIPDYLQQSIALGTTHVLLDMFNVYPNPAKNNINVTFNKTQTNVEIKIYNIQGQEFFTKENINSSIEIDISKFSSGIYFINIIDNEQTYTKRFIKE